MVRRTETVPLLQALDFGFELQNICVCQGGFLASWHSGVEVSRFTSWHVLKDGFNFRVQTAHAELFTVSQITWKKPLTMYINSMPMKKDNNVFPNLKALLVTHASIGQIVEVILKTVFCLLKKACCFNAIFDILLSGNLGSNAWFSAEK